MQTTKDKDMKELEIPNNDIQCHDCGITVMYYDGYLSSMSNVLCDRCYHIRIKKSEQLARNVGEQVI